MKKQMPESSLKEALSGLLFTGARRGRICYSSLILFFF